MLYFGPSNCLVITQQTAKFCFVSSLITSLEKIYYTSKQQRAPKDDFLKSTLNC